MKGIRKIAGTVAAAALTAVLCAGCGKSGSVIRMATKPDRKSVV